MSLQDVLIEIRDKLAYLYSSEDNALRVAQEAGVDTATIRWGSSPKTFWDIVVRKAHDTGRIRNLYKIVNKEYSAHTPPFKKYYTYTHRRKGKQNPPSDGATQVIASETPTDILPWLQWHNFYGNPFTDLEAAREQRLSEYFVDNHLADGIWAMASTPRSAVISANHGCGKTAYRVMLARSCQPQNPDSSILAIEYVNFSWFDEGVVGKSSRQILHIHCKHLLEVAIDTLVDVLLTDDKFAQYSTPPSYLGRLKWFWTTYGTGFDEPIATFRRLTGQMTGPDSQSTASLDWAEFSSNWRTGQLTQLLKQTPIWETPGGRMLGWLVDVSPEPLTLESLSMATLFQKLIELAQVSGLGSVSVLIDCADESHTLAAGTNNVVDMLGPLLAELPVMEVRGGAFIFFLSSEVARVLAGYPGVRVDRIPFYELRWTDNDLHDLLAQRLAAYSEGYVRDIRQLCEPTIAEEVADGLVYSANGVPRTLLHLTRRLFTQHCIHSIDKLLIQQQDWEKTRPTTQLPGIEQLGISLQENC